MKQKTVRFYSDSKSDLEAYEKLEHFREYGFNSGRELIIAAINAYSQKEQSSSGIDIETLAETIARKLSVSGITTISSNNEVETITEIDKSEVFDKALSFMESL